VTSNDLVHQVGNNSVYHVRCFACIHCQRRLSSRALYVVDNDRRIICKDCCLAGTTSTHCLRILRTHVHVYRMRLKTSPDKNCKLSELPGHSTTKFCTIIPKGWLHYCCTFYKMLLIYIEMAGSEIQSTKVRQPAMQNIYLITYQNKN